MRYEELSKTIKFEKFRVKIEELQRLWRNKVKIMRENTDKIKSKWKLKDKWVAKII